MKSHPILPTTILVPCNLSEPPSIDLLKRSDKHPPPAAKRLLSTWTLPLMLAIGFSSLFALLFRDRLLPAADVAVVPAMAIEDERISTPASAPTTTAASPGRLLFQASGWLEPDPLPVRATALTDGVISEVHVLEGQPVEAGQTLATLIDEDARISRDMLAAELAMKQAGFEAHCVQVQTSQQKLMAAQADLARARAALNEATDLYDRLIAVPPGATTETQRINARFEKDRAKAEVEMARARILEISWDFNRIAYETLAMQHGIDAATNALAEAELDFQRTRVTAPIRGRIMRLSASPGEKKMLGMEGMESATIATLYDPEKLQVRVDVPLADAAGLAIGQRTLVRCSLLPDAVFEGEVTRIAGEADIQRNTLQAKVRILNPDDRLRPEMICRVEFFERSTEGSNGQASTAELGLAIFVPQSSIVDASRVWVCDPETKRLESREVEPTRDVRDGWTRLESGILAGEWIVRDPAIATLKIGQRIRPAFNP